MMKIAAAFCIAAIIQFFYLYLETKREGKKITAKQVLTVLLGCIGIVALGYGLKHGLDAFPRAYPIGTFILSVILPAALWLWYKIKPSYFEKRENTAMLLLSYLLILIFITPMLGK